MTLFFAIIKKINLLFKEIYNGIICMKFMK